jgi:hypothetical protein
VIVEGLPAAVANLHSAEQEHSRQNEDEGTALPVRRQQSREHNGHKEARDSMLDDGGRSSRLFNIRSLVPGRV